MVLCRDIFYELLSESLEETMKAILEFNLPNEEPEFLACTNSGNFHSALLEIEREIDSLLNMERTDSETRILERLRKLIPHEVHEIG